MMPKLPYDSAVFACGPDNSAKNFSLTFKLNSHVDKTDIHAVHTQK